MKIPHSRVIKLTVPAIALFSILACTKDTDLLADYVVSDAQNTALFVGLVQDDFFYSSKGSPMILDVLANDGFNNPDKVKIVEVTQPFNGSVTINEDKTLTYNPEGDLSVISANENVPEEPKKIETAPQTDSEATTEEQQPKTVSQPEPQTQPETQPQPTPQPELTPQPEPAPKTEPQPEPKRVEVEENQQPAEKEKPQSTPENEQSQDEEQQEPVKTQETTQLEEEADENFNYKVEVEEEDGTVTEQKGTVIITKNERDYGVLKAFPTAYGGGSKATGARASTASTVYHVTNLNDSGSGSFRDAVSKSNRYIVFDVSGTIKLSDNFVTRANNLTIAGQTAPAGGISITGEGYNIFAGDNIILRYLTFRPQFIRTQADAIDFSNSNGFIMDHCSISWGTDEITTMESSCNNGTYQRNLIAEGNKSGTLIGNSGKPNESANLSTNNNLWYNVSHRFPNPSSDSRMDVINNVIYNFRYRLSRTQGSIQLNIIGNYYLRNIGNNYEHLNKVDYHYGGAIPQIHAAGNLVMPNHFTDQNADNWTQWTTFGNWSYNGTKYAIKDSKPAPRDFRKNSPHAPIGHAIPIKSARNAFKDVTNDVGNNKRVYGNGNIVGNQDDIDASFIRNVVNDTPVNYGKYGSNTYIPNSPQYKSYQSKISKTPVDEHPSNYDTDKDGMPNDWEIANGLNPNKMDHNLDPDGNGYSNIEEYINLVDF